MRGADRRRAVLTLAVGLAVAPLAVPVAAHAQTFSAPVQLGPPAAFAPEAVVAMSPGGKALAVWKSGTFGANWSTHAPGAAWTAPQDLLIAAGTHLHLHMDGHGNATLASVLHSGAVQATEYHQATSIFGRSLIVAEASSGTPIVLAGNPAGAEVIFYGNGNQVMAVRSATGATWGTPEVVATATGADTVRVVAGAMSLGGNMLVAWEASTNDCSTIPCNYNNYSVYAARELIATPGWVASPRLTTVIKPDPWVVKAVIDADGRGALLLQAGPTATMLQETRQVQATGPWGKVVAAYTDTSGGNPLLFGASIGRFEQASYAAVDVASMNSVLVGDGNIVTQNWSVPANLSIGDAIPPSPALAYGSNKSGGAALTWVDLDDTVRATLRGSVSFAFPPAETLVAGDSCSVTASGAPCRSPAAAAINAGETGVVLYKQTDATGAEFKVFAATTN